MKWANYFTYDVTHNNTSSLVQSVAELCLCKDTCKLLDFSLKLLGSWGVNSFVVFDYNFGTRNARRSIKPTTD